jgi:hypothetical protein
MRRPQFTIKTLLCLMLCAACFFGGMSVQRGRMDAVLEAERQSVRRHEDAVREYEIKLRQRDIAAGRVEIDGKRVPPPIRFPVCAVDRAVNRALSLLEHYPPHFLVCRQSLP